MITGCEKKRFWVHEKISPRIGHVYYKINNFYLKRSSLLLGIPMDDLRQRDNLCECDLTFLVNNIEQWTFNEWNFKLQKQGQLVHELCGCTISFNSKRRLRESHYRPILVIRKHFKISNTKLKWHHYRSRSK